MYNCSINMLEEFKDSAIWQDFLSELALWKEQIRTELEAVELVSVDAEMMRVSELRGNLKALVYFKDLPNILIRKIEIEKENEDG